MKTNSNHYCNGDTSLEMTRERNEKVVVIGKVTREILQIKTMQVKEKCQKIMTEKNNGNSAAKEERLTEHVEKKSLHRQYN